MSFPIPRPQQFMSVSFASAGLFNHADQPESVEKSGIAQADKRILQVGLFFSLLAVRASVLEAVSPSGLLL